MTLPVSGGVPEQGLRDALVMTRNLLQRFSLPVGEGQKCAAITLDAVNAALAALERPQDRCPQCGNTPTSGGCALCCSQKYLMERALERPRPALPNEHSFSCGCRVWREEDHSLSTRTCEMHHALWLKAQPTMGASGANGAALPAPEVIREAIHRTAMAAARVVPKNSPRAYLKQSEKDSILESVLKDFPGAALPPQTGNPPPEPPFDRTGRCRLCIEGIPRIEQGFRSPEAQQRHLQEAHRTHTGEKP